MTTHITLDRHDQAVYLRFSSTLPDQPPLLDDAALEAFAQAITQIHAESESLTVAVVESATPGYFLGGSPAQTLHALNQIVNNSKLALSLVKQIIKNSSTSDLQTTCYKESIASSVCLASADTQQRLYTLR